MATTRVKTWLAGEVLTASELNAEFDNLITNGPSSLGSPRTANLDLDGFSLIIDADADTYLKAVSDDVIGFYGQNTMLVQFDFSVASPVNAFDFVASATGSGVDLKSRGSDTNIGLRIQPKGSGQVVVDGGFAYVDGGGTADAITATYAPVISALDDGLLLGVEATAANATTTPTFAPNGLAAKTIVKNGNAALIAGDIEGDGHALQLRYSSRLDKWVLLNPKYPAGAPSVLDLNSVTTDATGGATGDFIPFVDVSDSNASNKVAVSDLVYNILNNGTEDTTPDPDADHVLTRDHSASAYKKVLIKNLAVSSNVDAPGFKGAPVVTADSTTSFALSDAGKTWYHTSASTHTWTIPANASVAFPVGTIILLENENGGGNVTVAITTDTLRWGSSTGSRTLAANGSAAIKKVASTTWRMTGTNIS